MNDIVNAAGRLRTSDQVAEMAVSLNAVIREQAATITALRSALAECADDLETSIRGRHPAWVSHDEYDDAQQRLERDMAPVIKARALLDTATTESRET